MAAGTTKLANAAGPRKELASAVRARRIKMIHRVCGRKFNGSDFKLVGTSALFTKIVNILHRPYPENKPFCRSVCSVTCSCAQTLLAQIEASVATLPMSFGLSRNFVRLPSRDNVCLASPKSFGQLRRARPDGITEHFAGKYAIATERSAHASALEQVRQYIHRRESV